MQLDITFYKHCLEHDFAGTMSIIKYRIFLLKASECYLNCRQKEELSFLENFYKDHQHLLSYL